MRIVIDHTNIYRIERQFKDFHKSAAPRVIRRTLNDLAFGMKGSGSKRGQIAVQAKKDFRYSRQANLFRVLTWVERASGYNTRNMRSWAGIAESPRRDELARRIAKHEDGEPIKHEFAPRAAARIGGDKASKVRRLIYTKKIDYFDATNLTGSQLIKSRIKASVKKTFIKYKSKKGDVYIAKGSGYKRNISESGSKGRNSIFKLTNLYKENEGKMVRIKKTPFIHRAAEREMKNLDKYFNNNARKEIIDNFERNLKK